MPVTRDDVEDVFGQQTGLSDSEKDKLLNIAKNLRTDVFGGRLTRFSELEGNEDDFITLLAAHLWVISQGGEVQSHSQTGGSVNFDHLTSNVESSLNETRYGRLCKMFLRDEASVGIVRADR